LKLTKKVGATSEIWQIWIADSSSTTGAGLTGLVFNTASLTAYYHKDLDTTATAITLVTMTVGTFTSSGFKEIDATNMPGWYQFCPPNAAISTGKSCGFLLKGATNMAQLPIEVQLTATDPDSATAFMTSVASVTGAVGSVTGAVGSVTGAVGSVTGLTASNLDATISSRMATYVQPTGFLAATFPTTVASPTNITAGTIATVTTLTNLPAITANWITAAGITAAALNGKGDWNIGKTGYALSTAGVQAIWDALTSALTTVGSIGKLIVTNLDAAISSRMATYTQPTGFLAATFPTGTVANTTNITAGTIATVTNLTNAPTAGDLTATMKTSVTTAASAATPVATVSGDFSATMKTSLNASTPASVTGAVGSVTGAVGSVTGAVGSVTGAVGSVGAGGITAASHAVGAFDAASLATDAANEIADALLDRNMATGADSGSPTVRTVRQALRILRNKASIAAGTLTVTAEDDTTASWTAAVTTAAGNPISAIDPA